MSTQTSTIVAELVARWTSPPEDASTPTLREELQITALPGSKWCVRDSRVPADDAKGLLGFIEKKGHEEDVRFEVLTLRSGFEWFSFATFQDAVQDFLSLSV